jgi:membrane-bound inhibitor of C-type lysozyme
MNKAIIGLLAVIIIGGGAYWYMQDQDAGSDSFVMGSYPYTCADGTEFAMVPADNMSTIRLIPGANASFGVTDLAKVESAEGARYEGGVVVFVGAGEEVSLTVAGNSTICDPMSNPDEAPFNFGDTGEGAGGTQDASLAVAANIVGKWKSVDDAKYVREFEVGGRAVEWYDDEIRSEGGWIAFTSANKPADIAFPLESGEVYVQMALSGAVSDKLNFRIGKLTPEELELVYMDRGGVLRFTKAQ